MRGSEHITVSRDIETVLNQAIVSVENWDVRSLNDASNRLVHDSATVQDRHSVRLSVDLYALSKLMGNVKSEDSDPVAWKKFWKNILGFLNDLRRLIITGDHDGFDLELKKMYDQIKSFDKKFAEHVGDILRKARVKKAFNIFEQGVSAGRVAELLDITQWEANKYIGWSNTFEREPNSDDAVSRFNKVKEVLDS